MVRVLSFDEVRAIPSERFILSYNNKDIVNQGDEMASKPQKTVLIGITGCIAAYKAAEIVRGLQKADVRVKVCLLYTSRCV